MSDPVARELDPELFELDLRYIADWERLLFNRLTEKFGGRTLNCWDWPLMRIKRTGWMFSWSSVITQWGVSSVPTVEDVALWACFILCTRLDDCWPVGAAGMWKVASWWYEEDEQCNCMYWSWYEVVHDWPALLLSEKASVEDKGPDTSLLVDWLGTRNDNDRLLECCLCWLDCERGDLVELTVRMFDEELVGATNSVLDCFEGSGLLSLDENVLSMESTQCWIAF